jgi:hypothetical protein
VATVGINRERDASPYKSRACVATELMGFHVLPFTLNAAHAKSHALVLCGLFLLLAVLRTIARAYPGSAEEKGTGKPRCL